MSGTDKPDETAAQLTAYLAALCEAVKAGVVQPRIANEVRIAVLETGEKPSSLLSITGGEPLSERGQTACAFLEGLGA